MTTFECVKCNTTIDCDTCGTKYCPNCGNVMLTTNGKKNQIKGICGKCKDSIYLAKVNDKVVYKCKLLDKQLVEDGTKIPCI